MSVQKLTRMTSIRISDDFRARLGRIRAELTLETGEELSMEDLLKLCVDAYEREREKEKERGRPKK
jgi:CRISPR/Cas system-associated protein Csm6